MVHDPPQHLSRSACVQCIEINGGNILKAMNVISNGIT